MVTFQSRADRLCTKVLRSELGVFRAEPVPYSFHECLHQFPSARPRRPASAAFPFNLVFSPIPEAFTRADLCIFYHTLFDAQFMDHLGPLVGQEECRSAIRGWDTEVVLVGFRLGVGPGWARRALRSEAAISSRLPPSLRLWVEAPAPPPEDVGDAVPPPFQVELLGGEEFEGSALLGNSAPFPAARGAADWVGQLLLEV